jgi:hypothetical protein
MVAALVVIAAASVGATTITPPMSTTTAAPAELPAAAVAPIEQVVSLTRTVSAGATGMSAFVVPAGQRLVVTDVVITNPGAAPACGASISATAAPATANPAATAGTTTAAIDSGTGVLCVPAQTSLTLTLTTGLEFASGETVMLTNAPAAAATTTPPATTSTAASGALHFLLRGFLVAGV